MVLKKAQYAIFRMFVYDMVQSSFNIKSDDCSFILSRVFVNKNKYPYYLIVNFCYDYSITCFLIVIVICMCVYIYCTQDVRVDVFIFYSVVKDIFAYKNRLMINSYN